MTRTTSQSPAPAMAARFAGWNLILPAIFFVLLAVSLVQALGLASSGALHGNDFKHLWAGAWLLAHGRSPYDAQMMLRVAENYGLGGINPYVYLPTTALMLRPLTWLPYAAAQAAWFWLNWMLAWGAVAWGPRWMRLARPWTARVAGAAFIVGAFPFYRQMTAGQMNVVTAALIILAAGALVRRRPALAGGALAVAAAWKISPALLILALPALRQWRAFGWAAAVGAALGLVSLALAGWGVNLQGLEVIGQMKFGQSTWAQFGNDFYRDPFNQSLNSLFHHLFTTNPYTTPWADLGPAVANRLTAAVTLAMLAGWGAAALASMWRPALRQAARARTTTADTTAASLSRSSILGRLSSFVSLVFFVVKKDLKPRTARKAQNSAGGPAAAGWLLSCSVLMLLAPSLMWDHYCVQLLPVLLWMWGGGFARPQAQAQETSSPQPAASNADPSAAPVGSPPNACVETAQSSLSPCPGGWAYYLGLALVTGLVMLPWFHAAPAWRQGPGIALMSLKLWPTLALLAWTAARAWVYRVQVHVAALTD